MPQIKKGELLVPGRTQWPEAFEYNYTRNGHEIRLFMRSPSRAEIKSIRVGKLDFALYIESGIPVMLFKTEAIPWCDCPYSYWLMPEDYRQIPPKIEPGQKALLSSILVDADTGIVHAIRVVTLSIDFSIKLHQAIAAQIEAGEFSVTEFARRSSKIQRKTAEDLASQADYRFSVVRAQKKGKGFG